PVSPAGPVTTISNLPPTTPTISPTANPVSPTVVASAPAVQTGTQPSSALLQSLLVSISLGLQTNPEAAVPGEGSGVLPEDSTGGPGSTTGAGLDGATTSGSSVGGSSEESGGAERDTPPRHPGERAIDEALEALGLPS